MWTNLIVMTTHANGALAAIARIPANLSRHDLTTRGAILSSVVALAIVTALDLIDGIIGILFSVGYLLAVTTAPLAVKLRGLYTVVLMPPVLLLVFMLIIASLAPGALVVENLPESTGVLGHAISATVKHGGILLLGQALAITTTLLRLWSAQNPRGHHFFSQG